MAKTKQRYRGEGAGCLPVLLSLPFWFAVPWREIFCWLLGGAK